ncbi:MAG: MBL fold metallo-hydrolase [Lachnospiraceae bacterium]|nr:MBL fold metallo-hydrolase [Lachnospiraceae bacterium]
MKNFEQYIHVLGVGHATVTKCYNTCFAINGTDGEYFLVDAGGGNGILVQLEKAGIPITGIHHMFVTHMHTDHVIGVIWMIRMVATAVLKGKYQGKFIIYCQNHVAENLRTICQMMLAKKHFACIDREIVFEIIEDGMKKDILGMDVEFLDIHSSKAAQFGCIFRLLNGQTIFFAGDEPLDDGHKERAIEADWLLHEAFCMDRDADIYKPYEKHHSTAKDAGMKAEELQVKNLVLWHSEDDHYEEKEKLYKEEASTVFYGNIYIPKDLDRILLQ